MLGQSFAQENYLPTLDFPWKPSMGGRIRQVEARTDGAQLEDFGFILKPV
jgi:hypothetical protein